MLGAQIFSRTSVKNEVNASRKIAWDAWVNPEDITNRDFASDEWCCPNVRINLEKGGVQLPCGSKRRVNGL